MRGVSVLKWEVLEKAEVRRLEFWHNVSCLNSYGGVTRDHCDDWVRALPRGSLRSSSALTRIPFGRLIISESV